MSTGLSSRRRVLGGLLAATFMCATGKASAADDAITVMDTKEGTGASPKEGQLVKCHYVLTLDGFSEDGGRLVDSSRSRGRPFRYNYGVGQVIKGWDQGVSDMRVGGRRRIIVPPSLGYGARNVGPIPANSTLYFDIELLGLDA